MRGLLYLCVELNCYRKDCVTYMLRMKYDHRIISSNENGDDRSPPSFHNLLDSRAHKSLIQQNLLRLTKKKKVFLI